MVRRGRYRHGSSLSAAKERNGAAGNTQTGKNSLQIERCHAYASVLCCLVLAVIVEHAKVNKLALERKGVSFVREQPARPAVDRRTRIQPPTALPSSGYEFAERGCRGRRRKGRERAFKLKWKCGKWQKAEGDGRPVTRLCWEMRLIGG